MDKYIRVYLVALLFLLVELQVTFCDFSPNFPGCKSLCLLTQDNDEEKIADYSYLNNTGDTGMVLSSTVTIAGDTGVSGTLPSLSI